MNYAAEFIKQLKHTKGIWYGINFDLLPWQAEIIKDVFGTLKPSGYRQYTTAYIEVPKKNGKSELAAAVALYTTCGDGERGGLGSADGRGLRRLPAAECAVANHGVVDGRLGTRGATAPDVQTNDSNTGFGTRAGGLKRRKRQ